VKAYSFPTYESRKQKQRLALPSVFPAVESEIGCNVSILRIMTWFRSLTAVNQQYEMVSFTTTVNQQYEMVLFNTAVNQQYEMVSFTTTVNQLYEMVMFNTAVNQQYENMLSVSKHLTVYTHT
jgi:hypothetical protein